MCLTLLFSLNNSILGLASVRKTSLLSLTLSPGPTSSMSASPPRCCCLAFSYSLATNTLAILFRIFTTPAVLIEGFGAGCSFAAVASLLSLDSSLHPHTRRSSVLLSLGGVAMHPSTFCSLVDAYAFHHSQDAQKPMSMKSALSATRDPLSDFQPTEPTELTYGFLIIQHLHDRKAHWTLTLLLLSHLHNKGTSVLTLHDDVAAQREKAFK